MDNQTIREARVIAGIELAREAINPEGCLAEEWGAPLPGDPDAIEAYAERHDPRYVVFASDEGSRLVRLCDTESDVDDVLRMIPGVFGSARRYVPHSVYSLANVIPVAGSHPGRSSNQHYSCIPVDMTDIFR
jgi:hypothetical protein